MSKLRSILQILAFVGGDIRTAPEFDVAPDPRTGPLARNPVSTLRINVSDSEPATRLAWVQYGGKYFTVNDTRWDRSAFRQFGDLFQTAVGTVEDVGIPITIAK